MKDVREIVLYFGNGSRLVPLNIANSLSERFKELGNPLVLPPEEVKKGSPLVVFRDNPEFMITVTNMTVNLVINYNHFDKMETIIFDLVDVFEGLDISLVRMGLVYSVFLSPDKIDAIKERLLNIDNLDEDMIDIRLSFFKKIKSKHGIINCWERIITDKDNFSDVLFQFDLNTIYDEKADFNMKYIKELVKIANDYSEERTDY